MKGHTRSRRAVVVGLCAAACFASTGVSAGSTEHVVTVDKLRFGPSPDGLVVGDTILWVNKDVLRHTATARDGAFDIDLPPGKEARVTLAAAGEVEVYCRFHPGMKLTLRISS